jgi:diacylglycerol kinase (ATP)
MKALMLFGPTASPRAADPFHAKDVDLVSGTERDIPGCDAVLIFGGDGTIHRYLPDLHAHRVPVLVVPAGSGNDFARSLGLRSEKIALLAWRAYCAGTNNVRDLDLGTIYHQGGNQTFFCCVAGAGLDALANARANRMPAWLRKRAGYLLAGLRELATFKPVQVELTTDTAGHSGKVLLVAVGNAHRYGGGMKVVPRADPGDGWLDVCVVGEMSRIKVLFCLPTIFFGAHIRLRGVKYFQARRVRIDSLPPAELYADGEPAGRTPLDIGLIPRGLKAIVPA